MQPGSRISRLLGSLAAGALLAALPVKVHLSPTGPSLTAAIAQAKDDKGGGDDHGGSSGRGGGDDHGGSSGRSGGDDHGGSSGRSGSDDRDGGDHGDRGGSDDRSSNSGRGSSGSDDRGGNSGRGGGGDDRGGFDDNGGDRVRGAGKLEITPTGIEVVHADGTKEEIENGRYERKDTRGRTIEERPATTSDFTRLSATGTPPSSRPTIRVGFVTKVEQQGGNLEILYSTGWKEELQDGRYELKDPNNNTVVQRPARQSDISRLQGYAAR